jgi:HK97 family phage portal protein
MKRIVKRFLSSISSWRTLILERWGGAWQSNIVVDELSTLKFFAVYSCVTLISQDVGKLRLRLMEKTDDGIWQEVDVAAFSPVLRKPNHYQTRQKFIEQWIISKLIHGNTYVLKQRDSRNVVVKLYVLDPTRVQPLIAPNGSVFYRLMRDDLSKLETDMEAVPASEIIHDTMVGLFHPLVGVSPLYAGGLAAVQGLAIQNNSARFFQNNSQPGGILTAPGEISDATAERLKKYWEENYTGNNSGRVAVLGDGLKFEGMAVTAVDAQLIEQLKWSAETVCSVFHVPPYKIGIGPVPTYQNAEVLNQIYYSDCLQALLESIEVLLDEGLATLPKYGTEFDLDDLLRMDSATKMKTAGEGVKAGIYSPNEARRKFNLNKVTGGESPYLQQQNYSLAALDERDRNNPLVTPPAPAPAVPEESTDEELDEEQAMSAASALKELRHVNYA